MEDVKFQGCFSTIFFETDKLYGFDYISCGLYEIDSNQEMLDVVIPSEDLRIYKNNWIRGIVKDDRYIILIPQNAFENWMKYDIKTHSYVMVVPDTCLPKIVSAITIGDDIYLIPISTADDIFVLGKKNLQIRYTIKNYYHEHRESWGAVYCKDKIYLPIVGTRNIIIIHRNKTYQLCLDMNEVINTIYYFDASLWILPISGSQIYRADDDGNLLDQYFISGDVSDAGDFVRIVVVKEYVILLPRRGETLCFIIRKNKKVFFRNIGSKSEVVRAAEFILHLEASFWDSYVHNGDLNLLPTKYGWKTVDLLTLDVSEKAFRCRDEIAYSKCVHQMCTRDNIFREYSKNSLRRFFAFLNCQ